MTGPQPQDLVLAVYPFSRGFAFVFFEGPDSPFEWGVKDIREKHKNSRVLEKLKELIDRYRPEVLVIEDTSDDGWHRTARIRKLYRVLAHLAKAEYIDLYRCSRKEVKACFASVGAGTKYEIAKAISTQIPAFAHRLPRLRKAWMNEDPRQSLFDATALGLTYFAQNIHSPYTDDIVP